MKKAYLKPRMKCVILSTNDDLYDGYGRETPKYTKIRKRKQRKKFPVWLLCHPPSTKMEADCFSGVRKHRKQAGPTLGGMGVLVLGIFYKQFQVGNIYGNLTNPLWGKINSLITIKC